MKYFIAVFYFAVPDRCTLKIPTAIAPLFTSLHHGSGERQTMTVMLHTRAFNTSHRFLFYHCADTGSTRYPAAFGIDVMLRIPTASYLTVSVAYSYSQLFEEIYTPLNVNNAFYYWSLKGSRHKISLTASIYNLFSIY